MVRSTRVWLGALALTVAASLAAAPLYAAHASKYLPKDTEVVATVNVRQILESGLVKKYGLDKVQDALKKDEVQGVLKSLGFDPLKDLTSITAAGPGGNEPDKALIIVEGKFDTEKFQAMAEKAATDHPDAIKITKSGAHKIWEVSPPGSPQNLYVVLVDKTTILAAVGQDAITTALKGKKAELSKALQAALETVDAKESMSFVALSSAIEKGLDNAPTPIPNADKVKEYLKKVDSISGGATVDNDVKLHLTVGAKDDKTAKELSGAASGLLALGKLMLAGQVNKNKDLKPVMDLVNSVKVSLNGKFVTLKGEVPAEVIEKAVEKVKERAKD